MADRKTVRDPKRSAIAPLAGMKIARLRRYEVSEMLMAGALTPKSLAMVGRAVASTVASSCSMNIALATISATTRKFGAARLTGAAWNI
ncbi:hypothetical protein RsS62_35920 [Rhizobium dioscoreae]|uniref:Uncharacterized protein n=1 Tax=Rhizobium dioscoreae TaxID=2653122 RepID=A0ABQ0YXI6_9HYPH|nr:hypothetical protein RsS62_35920 [Rhizobium dioscoreae]GES47739.1 hypothetical protein RsS93_03530 [Rhizobium dioscoreae]GLU79795.1 hypothetical protein Rhsp01_09710 [Rhizobium sp. NBRC 114257]